MRVSSGRQRPRAAMQVARGEAPRAPCTAALTHLQQIVASRATWILNEPQQLLRQLVPQSARQRDEHTVAAQCHARAAAGAGMIRTCACTDRQTSGTGRAGRGGAPPAQSETSQCAHCVPCRRDPRVGGMRAGRRFACSKNARRKTRMASARGKLMIGLLPPLSPIRARCCAEPSPQAALDELFTLLLRAMASADAAARASHKVPVPSLEEAVQRARKLTCDMFLKDLARRPGGDERRCALACARALGQLGWERMVVTGALLAQREARHCGQGRQRLRQGQGFGVPWRGC